MTDTLTNSAPIAQVIPLPRTRENSGVYEVRSLRTRLGYGVQIMHMHSGRAYETRFFSGKRERAHWTRVFHDTLSDTGSVFRAVNRADSLVS